MSRYILDTNILSYLIDTKSIFNSRVKDFLNKLNSNEELSTTTITLMELNYTLETLSEKRLHNSFKIAIEKIENGLNIYTITTETARVFSKLKHSYKNLTGINAKSAKKNDLDLIIASIAIEQNAVLVSNDNIFTKIADVSNLKTRTI